jgi:hypothetical protein
MGGLVFEQGGSTAVANPTRADTACLVGFLRRRGTPLPDSSRRWLSDQGWLQDRPAPWEADDWLNLPIPVDSFDAFDALFQWEERGDAGAPTGTPTWMGAAVKAFFEQGGLRCFIVRVGDSNVLLPPPADGDDAAQAAARTDRLARLAALLPKTPPSAQQRDSWKGAAVMIGLEEACMLLVPDLPELVADAVREIPATLEPVPGPEGFVDCTPPATPETPRPSDALRSPACSENGYLDWYRAVRSLLLLLGSFRRDAFLLASVPLPRRGDGLESNPTGFLGRDGKGLAAAATDLDTGLASERLQLAYPWVQADWGADYPEDLLPPEGFLAGLCSQGAATRGAHRSIARLPLRSVTGFTPQIPTHELVRNFTAGLAPRLADRVSLLGASPDGPMLLSDVTTSLETRLRPAAVCRLAACVLRSALAEGRTHVFEPAGAILRTQLLRSMNGLLSGFHAAGALAGPSEADSFSVRCDDTTTSQNDQDNGRVIVELSFTPAIPVGEISISMSLRDGQLAAVS